MRKKPSPSSSGKASSGSNGTHGTGTLVPAKSSRKKKKTDLIIPRLEPDSYDPLSGYLDNRELLRVLTEVRSGNFTARMPFDQVGLGGKICDTLNEIIILNEKMMQEFP